jgi:HEPN domain-containing protein
MNDRSLVDEWLEIANDDLDAAQYLFERPHRKQLEIICYHCQQSAEKSLKAYLCANGIEVPKTHEVGLLCHRCNELDSAFSDFFDDCEDLEIYATQTRYPNRIEVDEENAKQALDQAMAIYSFVSGQVQELFGDEDESQGMTLQ